jgi:hypothetical protein
MYQQLWGYKVEEKLYLGVREQTMLNTTGIQYVIFIYYCKKTVIYNVIKNVQHFLLLTNCYIVINKLCCNALDLPRYSGQTLKPTS